MGRHILHTGPVGSASILKVVTNYLATANLVSLCEALITSQQSGIDPNTAYEAIRISSGNSFVHETESQVVLNGSRNINFTMDLVKKDLSLFASVGRPVRRALGTGAGAGRHIRRCRSSLRGQRMVPKREQTPGGGHRRVGPRPRLSRRDDR